MLSTSHNALKSQKNYEIYGRSLLTYSRLGCAKKIDPKFIATIKTGKIYKEYTDCEYLKTFLWIYNCTFFKFFSPPLDVITHQHHLINGGHTTETYC